MPGLTLVWHGGAACRSEAPPVDLAAALHAPDYEARVLYAGAHAWLACTGYAAYPIAAAERGPILAVLEGRVHGPVDVGAIAQAMLATPPDAASLGRWLRDADGDFLLVAIDRRDGRAALLNDRYGRLPVYLGRDGTRVVASRELRLVAASCAHRRLDRAAVAEFLVFGYPLGSATLHEGVGRLPPATLLHGSDPMPVLPPSRFDAKREATDAAEGLASALTAACRVRAARDAPDVVTMSGGVDSRMVAAALRRAGVVARAWTHSDVHGVAARDVGIAREVSECLGLPWTLVELGAPTGREIAQLLRMKYGANYLGMSHVLPFFTRLVAEHGRRAVLFTGDGGDKVLVDQRPLVRLRDDTALVEYVLRREAILAADVVARLVGCRRDDLAHAVWRRVASYPEGTPDQRYVHFMFAERARKFLFEGEDRNRHYLWTVTPFYAPAVFELAMAVPDERKAQHRIRSEVLRRVGPEVAEVVNASTGYPLGDPRFRRRASLEHFAKVILHRAATPEMESRLRRRMNPPHGYTERSGTLRAVRRLLADCPAVHDHLDAGVLEGILADAGGYRREQFSVLLTLVALVDEVTQQGRALAALADATFD